MTTPDPRELARGHTPQCWEMPDCAKCKRRKRPHGRSVPMEAASGYCDFECDGYDEEPKSGHFWPEEEPELKAAVLARETHRDKFRIALARMESAQARISDPLDKKAIDDFEAACRAARAAFEALTAAARKAP